eukprot:gene1146-13674_t
MRTAYCTADAATTSTEVPEIETDQGWREARRSW